MRRLLRAERVLIASVVRAFHRESDIEVAAIGNRTPRDQDTNGRAGAHRRTGRVHDAAVVRTARSGRHERRLITPFGSANVRTHGADANFGPQIVATTAVPVGFGPPIVWISNYSGGESILQFTLANLAPQDVGVAQSFQTIADTAADDGQPLSVSAGHTEGDDLSVALPNASTASLGISYVSVAPAPNVTDLVNPPVPGASVDVAATHALYRIDTALERIGMMMRIWPPRRAFTSKIRFSTRSRANS